MIVMEQYYEIEPWHPEEDFEKIIKATRMCSQSESLGNTQEEKEAFIRKRIEQGHLSPFEHSSLSVTFVTNRGVTHELVRHRLAAYSQESTRYCNYSKPKFEVTFNDLESDNGHILFDDGMGNVRFIHDPCIKQDDQFRWHMDMRMAEKTYLKYLEDGYTPQVARAFLPNDLKTQIMVTANLHEWRHIFELRCDTAAHPHIRALLTPLLKEVQSRIPVIFDDILEKVECQETQ